MNYPKFFDNIQTIKLQDKLSDFLGTFENGNVEFSYLDIVKSAGHSCPTVAGAYLVTLEGLKALYKNEIPCRGEIQVEFKENVEEGVAGVIGNVISNITGATTNTGFKGIGGNFNRCDLMFFDSNINSSVRFTRLDNNTSVDVYYDPSSIKPNPMQMQLMQKIMQNAATDEEKILFGKLWQERVENIFANIDKVIKLTQL